MKMRIQHYILILLTLLVLVIRIVPGAGEFYAIVLYPYISAVLSWISSFVPFSLDEVVALLGIALLILTLIIGIRNAWKWQKITLRIFVILLWYVVWFYLGWGCNYFRNDFYTRMQIVPARADKEVFLRFANDYLQRLHHFSTVVYGPIDSVQTERPAFEIDQEQVVTEIKQLYQQVTPEAGLCMPKGYQQPKEMLLNRLYSASGVLGFMGPWMGENLLNTDLLPVQFPSTYAHEYAHLLGISNEAEANYWSYYICTKSKDPKIQYSVYSSLLVYVLTNARVILTEDEYREFYNSIRPEIIQERLDISAHWQALHINLIDKTQNLLLDLQLKGNNIPSGTSNYNQVIAMIISAQESAKK